MKRYVKLTKEVRKEALKKWRLYNQAEKQSKMPIYKDLKRVYVALKDGKTVLDIHDVMKRAGIRSNGHPKLAIARITEKTVWCKYWTTGSVKFVNSEPGWRNSENRYDVFIEKVLPSFNKETLGTDQWRGFMTLKAPIPLVPPQFLPKKVTKDYYVLWEVDVWENVPPRDPYILKRLTANMFVVLAAWELTPIERAVMKGRM
jgi:hypothetical protein